jgi:hypothetical protein
LPVSERGALIDSRGALNQTGVKRLQTALALNAYDSPALVQDAFESPAPSIKSIADVLVNQAPAMLKIRQAVLNGELRQDRDITPAINETVNVVLKSRRANAPSITEQVAQKSLDGESDASPRAKAILQIMFKGNYFDRQRSKPEIERALNLYTQAASKETDGTVSVFSDTVTPESVLSALVNTSHAFFQSPNLLKNQMALLLKWQAQELMPSCVTIMDTYH